MVPFRGASRLLLMLVLLLVVWRCCSGSAALPDATRAADHMHCDRAASRTVRRVVQQVLLLPGW